MAEFNMTLRGREVHVTATIHSMNPIKFTIELRDPQTHEELDWKLSRDEVTQVCRQAATVSAQIQSKIH